MRYLHNFIEACVVWIFPPSADRKLVDALDTSSIAQLYRPSVQNGVHTLSSYRDVRVRALVHEAKFAHNTHAQEILGMLGARFFESKLDVYDLIIPIPLSKERMRERGHNQVLEVLKRIPLIAPLTSTTVLVRIKNTLPQTSIPREERAHNVLGAFSVAKPELVAGKRILLVDDVLTTGSTLRAAKAALLRHSPASLTCLTFAH